MDKKYKRIIKIIVALCIFVLLVDLVVLIHNKFFKEEKKVYFDGINSFQIVDDNIIAVGSNSNNDEGYEKAKITLYNSKFEKNWESIYNKKYNSSFSSVKKDIEDNAYIAVGSYESSKKEHKSLTRSAVIVKFDKDGKFLAEKKFQLLGDSRFTNIKVVDDGYIVVGQSIYENMTLGFSEEGGAFIIKYDKELKEVWRHNYGGSKSGIYNDLIIVDDNIYAVGKDLERQGIISKYDLNGEYIDTATYDNTDTLGFTGIANKDDNLYVVGSKKVEEDKSSFDTDALIVKYDLDLEQEKDQTYRGRGMERYNRIIVDSNSNIVVVGQTGLYSKKESTEEKNIFKYDGLIAKYNEDLDELLVDKYGDIEDDYFTDITQYNDNYLVSGYSKFDGSYISKFITYTKSGKVININ